MPETTITSSTILGTEPSLPSFLRNWKWLTEPVRAERAASVRIATGLVLLIDILFQYLPEWRYMFGPDGIGSPEVYADYLAGHITRWSLLRHLPAQWGPLAALIVWAVAAIGLTLGYRPRMMAVVCWALAVSFFQSDPYFHNGGDRIKISLLFFLMFLPSDGAWTIRRNPTVNKYDGPVYVRPWPLRLIFVQLTTIYFFNGYYKGLSPHWQNGTVLHYVMHNPGWSLVSGEYFPKTPLLLACMSWVTLIWEMGFPLFVVFKPTRNLTLLIGVVFHLLTFFQLAVGLFPIYAICGYLPFFAWEKFSKSQTGPVD